MKLYSPAAERNAPYIAEVLKSYVSETTRLAEIASGTGQHCICLAKALKIASYQPSDLDEESVVSIEAYREAAQIDRLAKAKRYDVVRDPWPFGEVDLVLNINMIHISPWEACEALVDRASMHLTPAGHLIFYGPFLQDGVETAPSNFAFDESLRGRNPHWGIRHLEAVTALCKGHDFRLLTAVPMPANNLTVVFQRQ